MSQKINTEINHLEVEGSINHETPGENRNARLRRIGLPNFRNWRGPASGFQAVRNLSQSLAGRLRVRQRPEEQAELESTSETSRPRQDQGFEIEELRREVSQEASSYFEAGVEESIVRRNPESSILGMIRNSTPELAVNHRALLVKKKSVNSQDSNGDTGLIRASGSGNRGMVKHLITQGGNPNIQNHKGDTALIHAVCYGDASIVRALIRAGAYLNHQDGRGLTPLILSANYASAECMQVLLKAGADPTSLDQEGNSVVEIGRKYFRTDDIRIIEDAYQRAVAMRVIEMHRVLELSLIIPILGIIRQYF